MFLKAVIIPVLVGLIPTFFIMTCEFGHIRAAAIKYAAEEMSPGTCISLAVSSFTGFTVIVLPSLVISAPR